MSATNAVKATASDACTGSGTPARPPPTRRRAPFASNPEPARDVEAFVADVLDEDALDPSTLRPPPTRQTRPRRGPAATRPSPPAVAVRSPRRPRRVVVVVVVFVRLGGPRLRPRGIVVSLEDERHRPVGSQPGGERADRLPPRLIVRAEQDHRAFRAGQVPQQVRPGPEGDDGGGARAKDVASSGRRRFLEARAEASHRVRALGDGPGDEARDAHAALGVRFERDPERPLERREDEGATSRPAF